NCVKEAQPFLLEPIMNLEVLVPEEQMGDVLADLNSRRGRVLGMEATGAGLQRIKAHVPMAETFRYATDLRSMTGGRGTFTADVKVNLYDRGLSLEIPARWTWNAAVGFVNRATSRYFLAANGPLTDLPVVPGNGDVDASALPTGRVVVAVEEFCRLGCSGPTTETALPLDWSTAAPFFGRTVPSDRHEGAIGFRLFDQPLFVVARWADDAPAADI